MPRPVRAALCVLVLTLGSLLAADVVPAPCPASAIPTVGWGARTRPRVALTFDDNIDGPRSRAVLRILQTSRTPATVFVIGREVVASPRLTRLIVSSGVEIGDHSLSHRRMTGLSPAALAAEIGGGTDAVRRLTGHPTAPLFRPPYGESDATVAKAAAADGMQAIVLWDIDTKDWQGRPTAAIVRSAVDGARNGSIILMHLNARHTYEALPAVIAGLKARGFQLVTVTQLLRGRLHAARTSVAGSSPPEPHRPGQPTEAGGARPATRLTDDEQVVLRAIETGLLRPAAIDRLGPERPLSKLELEAIVRRLHVLADGGAPTGVQADTTGGGPVRRLDLAETLADAAWRLRGWAVPRPEALPRRLRFSDVPYDSRGAVGGVVEQGLVPMPSVPASPESSLAVQPHTRAGLQFHPWAEVTRADAARSFERVLALTDSIDRAAPAILLLTSVDPFWSPPPSD